MDRQLLEKKLANLPLLQYEFIKTEELTFSDNVRTICEMECPMYGKTWACPPAVGDVGECKERCMQYEEAILIATIAEVNDIADIEETLATRGGHEEITREVKKYIEEQAESTLVLSTEACSFCKNCSYPDEPCQHPDYMFPCVESHGIIVTEVAEKYNIPILNGGNIVIWFSIIFYK